MKYRRVEETAEQGLMEFMSMKEENCGNSSREQGGNGRGAA